MQLITRLKRCVYGTARAPNFSLMWIERDRYQLNDLLNELNQTVNKNPPIEL